MTSSVSVWCLACHRVGTVIIGGPTRLRALGCPACGTTGQLRRVGRAVADKLRELYRDPAWRSATGRLARTRIRQEQLYPNAAKD